MATSVSLIIWKSLNTGPVPSIEMHPGWTVPPFKMHPGGTVPPFKIRPGGTLNFYELIFFSLNLDWGAKINDRSLRPFLNLSPLSLISLTPSPVSSWSHSDGCLYASRKECLKNQCLLHLNLPPLHKKRTHSLLLLSFWFFGYTHQLSNARGCHFIKIWFNGSIRTSFTESYKIKQRLPHRPIRAPMFIYFSWAASYIRQPIYVGQ